MGTLPAPPRRAIIFALVVAGIVVAAVVLPRVLRRDRLVTAPATRAAETTTHPATAVAAKSPRTLIELIRSNHPHYPATQPLDRAVDLRYAGHFVIAEPLYMDRQATFRSNLWITRADAEPTDQLLAQRTFEQVLVTRERPVFVHWQTARGGNLRPSLFSLNEKGDGYEHVDATGRRAIGQGLIYDWARARSVEDRIIVPTKHSASVFLMSDAAREIPGPELADGQAAHAPVQIQFDMSGVLAWIPPLDGHPGSAGAIRFADGKWTRLSSDMWGTKLLHLVPLLDGSILQLVAAGDGGIKLNLVVADAPAVNPRRVAELVGELSETDPKVRDKAFAELSQVGPGAHPLIEKMLPGEPPEAQARLRELLKTRVTPLLGHMRLLDGPVQLISRHPDGGVLLFARDGVAIPRGDEPAQIVRPAWLSIRPGETVRVLESAIVRDLDPAKVKIIPWFQDWIVIDDIQGPRRFFGNRLVPILRKNETEFSEFIGIDGAGRFLFHKSDGATLLIDPYLPDPTPRLPVWVITEQEGSAGWDDKGYPAIQRGTSAASLLTGEWRFHEAGKDQFLAKPEDAPKLLAETAPTTTTTQAAGEMLLRDSDGNLYFDGKTALRVRTSNGKLIEWTLPAAVVGDGPVHLVKTRDDRLYLFNQPGRLLRLRSKSDASEPFVIEATFTRRIPNTKQIARMWIDPVHRLVIAHSGKKLAVCFPDGYIPPATANLMSDADENSPVEE